MFETGQLCRWAQGSQPAGTAENDTENQLRLYEYMMPAFLSHQMPAILNRLLHVMGTLRDGKSQICGSRTWNALSSASNPRESHCELDAGPRPFLSHRQFLPLILSFYSWKLGQSAYRFLASFVHASQSGGLSLINIGTFVCLFVFSEQGPGSVLSPQSPTSAPRVSEIRVVSPTA